MLYIKYDNVSLNLEVVGKMTASEFANDPQIKGLFKGKDEAYLRQAHKAITGIDSEVKTDEMPINEAEEKAHTHNDEGPE